MEPGEREPLKMVGFALLLVGLVAAIIGLVTLASGGSSSTPSAGQAIAPSTGKVPPPPPSSAAPRPPGAGPAVPSNPGPAGPGPSAGVAPPPSAGPVSPPEAGPVAPVPRLPGAGLPSDDGASGTKGSNTAKATARVYNNSLIKGLAERAAQDMRDAGWQVSEVGNYPDGTIPTSTVYYRAGTREQAAARHLADSFGLRTLPRFAGIQDASPGLIVIVTKDYQRR